MIRVIDQWVIDTDGRQYVGGKLAYKTDSKGNTTEYIQQPFYYPTLSGCLRAISARLRIESIKDTEGDLQAALAALKAADTRLIEAISVFDELIIKEKSL